MKSQGIFSQIADDSYEISNLISQDAKWKHFSILECREMNDIDKPCIFIIVGWKNGKLSRFKDFEITFMSSTILNIKYGFMMS